MESVAVSAKGWVVIPAELRRKYNLRPGVRVRIVDYVGCPTVIPVDHSPWEATTTTPFQGLGRACRGVLSIVPENDDPVANAAGMLHCRKSLTEALLAEHRAELAHEQ